jgi:hypothetical protein
MSSAPALGDHEVAVVVLEIVTEQLGPVDVRPVGDQLCQRDATFDVWCRRLPDGELSRWS